MERPDRITDIRLEDLRFHCFRELTRMMGTPFPALTYLSLGGVGSTNLNMDPHGDSILSDVFLGGSAPSLRTLILSHLRFPALPKLLLSATQLVTQDTNPYEYVIAGDSHLLGCIAKIKTTWHHPPLHVP